MHPYNNLAHFRRDAGILPKPSDDWRLIQVPVTGEINGLPSIRGLAVATNGIIVALRRSDSFLVYGHLEWFLKDRNEPISDLDSDLEEAKIRAQVAKTSSRKVSDLLDDIFGTKANQFNPVLS